MAEKVWVDPITDWYPSKQVSPKTARFLVKTGKYRIRESEPEQEEAPKKGRKAAGQVVPPGSEAASMSDADDDAGEYELDDEGEVRISPRTGKPVRKYRRRDLEAED